MDIIYSPFVTEWNHGDQPPDDRPGRSLVDRPDDVEGPQVRVLYVLPADAPDLGWDVSGELHAAVATTNQWLYANGGGSLRFDTYGGELDVGFVRLADDEATLWMQDGRRKCDPNSMCPNPYELLSKLQSLGVTTPGKIHVMVWGGQLMPASTRSVGCAGALPDAVFMSPLLRFPDSGLMGCFNGFTTSVPDSTNTLGLVMFHEVFHVLGAVDNRAPDADGGYHIEGDVTDLMGGSGGTVRLDPQRRNYWGHGRSDLADVTRSPVVVMEPSTMAAAADDFARPWWFDAGGVVDPNDAWSPDYAASRQVDAAPRQEFSAGTLVSVSCGEASGDVVSRATGTLMGASGPAADQPVALIWVDVDRRCLADTTTSDSAGRFTVELRESFYRQAAWADGGGYCLVWDLNLDAVFDSDGEPVLCADNALRGSVIDVTLSS